MDNISRKMEKVADFPLKLNLQLFADEPDGTPNLEDTPEFREDAKEFNAKMDKFTESRTPKEKAPETPVEPTNENKPAEESNKAVTPDVAVPDDKPKQDSETNKAFQEMRQKLEAAEKEKVANEARAKKADELIAQQYGPSHGIYTVEQYEQRLKQEKDNADNERYQQAGLTPDEVEKLRKFDELQNETESQKQEWQRAEQISQWETLYKAYPDIVESSKMFNEGKDPEWYTAEMKAEIARGASPIAAYRNAHFETIMQNSLKETKEVAKQEALNQLNSKEHIKPSGAASGDVEHVEIDGDTMRMYRQLNKGKSDAEIRAWHKKNAM